MGWRQQQLAKVILQDPAVESLSSFIGVDGTNITPNSGRIQITLKPLEERDADASAIIRRLQPKLAQVNGITLYMQPIQDLTVEDRVSRTQFQYSVESPNTDELNTWVPRLLEKLKEQPDLRDVAADQQNGGLGLMLDIDRDTAARLGITPQNIDDTLYDAFGQRQVSTIFTQLNQYHVVLETQPRWQNSADALKDIYIKAAAAPSSSSSTGISAIAAATQITSTQSASPITSPQGSSSTNTAMSGTQTSTSSAASPQAPLSAFARVRQINVPLAVNHQGQFPSVTLSFNLAPEASLGKAVDAIRKTASELGMPASMQTSFQGTAAAFEASLANESLLILAAIVTVYIVLGVLYESYIHPITILSTLPSAGVGAILALMLFKQDLGVIALIGIILLIGIVKKNAIMMIDFALEAERVEGKPPLEAIYQASLLRFRPIMMTTMAALLGAVPLAVGTGTGSELRRPLGITIIGGLIFSQVLTLFTTPVIYLAFDRLGRWVARRRGGEAGEQLPLMEES
jgi:multidrug efflux pump